DRLRSRSRATRRHGRMRASRDVAAGNLRALRTEELSQNLRLKRLADLCAAAHANELRKNQTICPCARPIAGRRTPGPGGVGHEEGDPHRQGAGGLEPE